MRRSARFGEPELGVVRQVGDRIRDEKPGEPGFGFGGAALLEQLQAALVEAGARRIGGKGGRRSGARGRGGAARLLGGRRWLGGELEVALFDLLALPASGNGRRFDGLQTLRRRDRASRFQRLRSPQLRDFAPEPIDLGLKGGVAPLLLGELRFEAGNALFPFLGQGRTLILAAPVGPAARAAARHHQQGRSAKEGEPPTGLHGQPCFEAFRT